MPASGIDNFGEDGTSVDRHPPLIPHFFHMSKTMPTFDLDVWVEIAERWVGVGDIGVETGFLVVDSAEIGVAFVTKESEFGVDGGLGVEF